MEVTLQHGPLSGLYAYEIILLVMGILLFLVTIWAVIRAVRRDKPIWGTLPLLLFVVVFVGYPSIQAIQLSDASIEVDKLAAQSESPPNLTPEQKQKASEQIALVASRLKTPEAQAVAARAYRAIGEDGVAAQIAREVQTRNPKPEVARTIAPIVGQNPKEDDAGRKKEEHKPSRSN